MKHLQKHFSASLIALGALLAAADGGMGCNRTNTWCGV